MIVESFCSHKVLCIDGNPPPQRAALLMREPHVGAIVITEAGWQAAAGG